MRAPGSPAATTCSGLCNLTGRVGGLCGRRRVAEPAVLPHRWPGSRLPLVGPLVTRVDPNPGQALYEPRLLGFRLALALLAGLRLAVPIAFQSGVELLVALALLAAVGQVEVVRRAGVPVHDGLVDAPQVGDFLGSDGAQRMAQVPLQNLRGHAKAVERQGKT